MPVFRVVHVGCNVSPVRAHAADAVPVPLSRGRILEYASAVRSADPDVERQRVGQGGEQALDLHPFASIRRAAVMSSITPRSRCVPAAFAGFVFTLVRNQTSSRPSTCAGCSTNRAMPSAATARRSSTTSARFSRAGTRLQKTSAAIHSSLGCPRRSPAERPSSITAERVSSAMNATASIWSRSSTIVSASTAQSSQMSPPRRDLTAQRSCAD